MIFFLIYGYLLTFVNWWCTKHFH